MSLVRSLKKHAGKRGDAERVVWVYLPIWTVLECLRELPHALLVYEVIDALSSNPAGVSRDFLASEKEILRQADLVITSSESLFKEKIMENTNTHWVPSGVADIFYKPHTVVPEIEEIPCPRIGFFGTLDHRIDIELMCQVARDHPEWSFVIVGPARCDVSPLFEMENVHWLGAKSHSKLPGYLAGLDVIYLPYKDDNFTRHIYPAKIHECFATGIPVVATVLPALEAFDAVMLLVRSGQDFAGQIEVALAEDDPQLPQHRKKIAQANSWEVRHREIRELVKEAIARKTVSTHEYDG